MKNQKVIISSTVFDLPEHRKAVMEACLRQSMFPLMMENLPASNYNSIEESMRLVEEADIYLGVFAHRYGYVPKGQDISITEMEYNTAKARGIPALIFIIHEDHMIKAGDVDIGVDAYKLKDLKNRLKKEHVVNFFKSPDDLRSLVINTLSHYRESKLTDFHFISEIPRPPVPYIAHPYSLIETDEVVGRQKEINLFNEWAFDPKSKFSSVRILNVVAMGGMGKSALTWKWFNQIESNVKRIFDGKIWWSFYESDASFENFVIRCLAYVKRQPKEKIALIPVSDREGELISILSQYPFLIVMDGLERIMIAYARMSAESIAEDVFEQNISEQGSRISTPEKSASIFSNERRRLRRAIDPRNGVFLRKLAGIGKSRVLVSTRLYPAELETETGKEIPGAKALYLTGLDDQDALQLWEKFEITGSKNNLLPLFNSFDNYPLLIRALAGEIASFRASPKDFDKWIKANPTFNPFRLPIIQRKSHVLKYAIRGLDSNTRIVLLTISALRMPVTYSTLVALLVGPEKSFINEGLLDDALSQLEDRGLVGWDRRANRYDLHPIVRGITWNILGKCGKHIILRSLLTHFETLPAISNEQTKNFEDLITAIEIYNCLTGLGQYDNAYNLFENYIDEPTLKRLSASRQRTALLEMLFTDGIDNPPKLGTELRQAYAIADLAYGYLFSGQPQIAISLFEKCITLKNTPDYLSVLSNALRLTGQLQKAEIAARKALLAARPSRESAEAFGLIFLGWILAARNLLGEASKALNKSLLIHTKLSQTEFEALCYTYLSQLELWQGNFCQAEKNADKSLELAQIKCYPRDIIRALRAQGIAKLNLDKLSEAEQCLLKALREARNIRHVEEEIPILIGLARLYIRKGELKIARGSLDEVWELVERGPYTLFHADALNDLTRIEILEGNSNEAIRTATRAFYLSWCDGHPFAYYWGLETARSLLRKLNTPEPKDVTEFDASVCESMPNVNI